ncbi:transposable element Tcb2 transposase [Trichonephila clavipes]|nr:transposable element Tcb2 transposase [Trichonephila clavipes]
MSTMSQRSHLTDSEAWRVVGSAGRRPGQGRRWRKTPNEDRYLVLTARRHRNMNATRLQQHLRSATGTTVSTQTVRNLLHGVGLYARRPMGLPRANLVEDFLFEEGIVRMEWPACFPDMNPIEHVWDALGGRVAGRQPPPQTLQELERALLEEWHRIPQLVIDSMPQSVRPSVDKGLTPKLVFPYTVRVTESWPQPVCPYAVGHWYNKVPESVSSWRLSAEFGRRGHKKISGF